MIGADVFLWGTHIGAVTQDTPTSIARFNYDPAFLQSGIELSPFTMPLSNAVYSFRTLSPETFHGLPGMLADSLPDKFGSRLIERYLTEQNRSLSDFSAVESLCYVGTRGMGALEYQPATDLASSATDIDINLLVQLASDILTERESLDISARNNAMEQLIQVGTSAGGARAKAIIAWNRETNHIKSGQIDAGTGYEHYIIKFDGVSNNRDKDDKADGPAYTRIEYAYSLMAKEAGIQMMPCELYEESGRYHFMTKRFDRAEGTGDKIHLQTLGALAHYDFNMPGAHSYEQVVLVMRQLGLGQDAVTELYRRMVFNVLARNHDDHVKNLSFLMDRTGQWALSPAYDLTFAYNPANLWLARHQMSINGKLDHITVGDLLACASKFDIKPTRALSVIHEVDEAISHWQAHAAAAKLPPATEEKVAQQLLRAETLE